MNTASLVPDDLWEAVEPLLPREQPKPKGGRPRIPDRAALGGIVFVLRTGCPWLLLPKELGCGSGWTCWCRLRYWQKAGVWQRLHVTLLHWLGDGAAIDWSRASVDSLSVRAKGGEETGPTPVERGKRGSKYHLVVDRHGIPLAVRLSAANTHDSTQLLPLVDAVPSIHRPPWEAWSPSKASRQAERRQSLRFHRAALARDHTAHCVTWN